MVLSLRKKRINKERVFIVVSVIILATVAVRAMDRMGAEKWPQEKERCPIDMVFVPVGERGICIDKFEASAGQDCPNLAPVNQQETRENLDYFNCRPVSRPGAVPWRFISRDQAARACAKADKRLPTNKEWLQAALGTSDSKFAVGSDDCQVSNNWPSQPGPTGFAKNCVSGAGAYDMVGNVWEWVAGEIKDGYFNNRRLPDAGYINFIDDNGLPAETSQDAPDKNYNNDYFWLKRSGWRGIARGGYWNNDVRAGQYAVYMEASPTAAIAGVGFRCVAIVKQ